MVKSVFFTQSSGRVWGHRRSAQLKTGLQQLQEGKLPTFNTTTSRLTNSKVLNSRSCKAVVFPFFIFGSMWFLQEQHRHLEAQSPEYTSLPSVTPQLALFFCLHLPIIRRRCSFHDVLPAPSTPKLVLGGACGAAMIIGWAICSSYWARVNWAMMTGQGAI